MKTWTFWLVKKNYFAIKVCLIFWSEVRERGWIWSDFTSLGAMNPNRASLQCLCQKFKTSWGSLGITSYHNGRDNCQMKREGKKLFLIHVILYISGKCSQVGRQWQFPCQHNMVTSHIFGGSSGVPFEMQHTVSWLNYKCVWPCRLKLLFYQLLELKSLLLWFKTMLHPLSMSCKSLKNLG